MDRVIGRFNERAKQRDVSLETDLADLYRLDSKESSLAQAMLDPDNHRATAQEATLGHREYMVREGVQQYRDYYESDAEELSFFEYLDNLSNRDRIRFMEVFEDFSVDQTDQKKYIMIKKREFNPELSAFSNLLLDLVDFRDRVRPIAKDIALLDVSKTYQKQNVNELEAAQAEFAQELRESESAEKAQESVEEGYSSKEIAAESDLESAKPDLEAAAEQNNFDSSESSDESEKKQ